MIFYLILELSHLGQRPHGRCPFGLVTAVLSFAFLISNVKILENLTSWGPVRDPESIPISQTEIRRWPIRFRFRESKLMEEFDSHPLSFVSLLGICVANLVVLLSQLPKLPVKVLVDPVQIP